MVSQARENLQYTGSSDPNVAQASITIRTGRKWKAADAVKEAESRLQHKVLVGRVAQGKAGLGNTEALWYDTARGKE